MAGYQNITIFFFFPFPPFVFLTKLFVCYLLFTVNGDIEDKNKHPIDLKHLAVLYSISKCEFLCNNHYKTEWLTDMHTIQFDSPLLGLSAHIGMSSSPCR